MRCPTPPLNTRGHLQGIADALKQCDSVVPEEDFGTSATRLLGKLGYKSDRVVEADANVQEFLRRFPAPSAEKGSSPSKSEQEFAAAAESARILFQYTAEEINDAISKTTTDTQASLLFEKINDAIPKTTTDTEEKFLFVADNEESFLFVAVELKSDAYRARQIRRVLARNQQTVRHADGRFVSRERQRRYHPPLDRLHESTQE